MTDSAWPALVDHHCHGVVTRDLDRGEFEALLNEASGPSPLGTSFFDSMLGLAVRRHCAPVLGLPPLAPPEEYLAKRREIGAREVTRRMLKASGAGMLLVDTGFAPDEITSPDELADLGGCSTREILRLETTLDALLEAGVPPVGVPEALRAVLESTSAVGVKSIAAYRVGLRLPAAEPSDDDVAAALETSSPDQNGSFRLTHPVVIGWLAWQAIRHRLPLQLHVGYGDADLGLRECDPLLLTGFLRATEEHGVPVMLLHNYPYHRHAAYLAQIFPHVFMDVGLATHNTGALSPRVVEETLELAPFGKMLYSSDAFGLAEHYLLGATLFKGALDGLLDRLIAAGDAAPNDRARVVGLISGENARRVYRLSD